MPAPPIRLPTGVRDFLPRAAARRRALAEAVLAVFERWGYARIITPAFECADVLERGLGVDARATAIRFVEPGTGEVVALRPDITPQIARVVATRMHEVPGPIRLCYEGSVTRLAAEGGQREILQAGIELIDAGEPHGDAEVLAVAADALAAAQLPEVRLDVGHVAPARFVLDAAGEHRERLTGALARKDRAALRAVARLLPEGIGPLAEALGMLWGPAGPTLTRAMALPWPAWVAAALSQLRAVIEVFHELAGEAAPPLSIDLGDLRGFDYYTGVRFAGYATGAAESVHRGGRYDDLLARYGRAARATGFAIDLESVAQAQRAAGLAAPPSRFAVAITGPGAAAIARALRAAGLRAVTGADAGADAILDLERCAIGARDASGAIAAARVGQIQPLVTLLQGG